MTDPSTRCAFVYGEGTTHWCCGGFEKDHPVGMLGQNRHVFVPPSRKAPFSEGKG